MQCEHIFLTSCEKTTAGYEGYATIYQLKNAELEPKDKILLRGWLHGEFSARAEFQPG